MAYEEPELPVAGNPVSVSGFGAKVRNSIIWLKSQIDNSLAVTYHQGGSETQLNVPGTSNYAKSGETMIHGVAYFPTGSATTTVTVTYPFTWAHEPEIILGAPYQYGTGGYSGYPWWRLADENTGQTTTDFKIVLGVNDRTCVFAVPWIAIGTPA